MELGDIEILIVDDVNSVRVQIKQILGSAGFRKMEIAENGEIAKAKLLSKNYHLVLADWHMTPGNGLDLLRFVRAADRLHNVSFVMVTGESTRDMVIEAVTTGVDDYVIKPMTIQSVQTKVFNALKKRQYI